jgi:RHS repeat-associated protein
MSRAAAFALLSLLLLLTPLAVFAQAPICDVTCGPGDSPGSGAYDVMQQARPLPLQWRAHAPLSLPYHGVVPGSRSFNYVVPVLSLPGRNGLSLNLSLYYNSRVWGLESSLTKIDFNVDSDFPTYGFRLDFGLIQGPYNNDVGTTSYILTESDGTKRELRYNSANLFDTYDSTYIEWNSSTQVLRRKDGTQVSYQVAPNTADKFRPIQIENTNGNVISVTYTADGPTNINTITDTAGRVFTYAYDTSHRLQTVSEGSQIYATFAWGTRALNYNFGQGVAVDAPASGTALNVITGVTLVNGIVYQFTWGDWGVITEVQRLAPNGAVLSSVRYDIPPASVQLSDAPGFANQYMARNGSAEAAWAYSFAQNSGKNVTAMTVTDAANTVVSKTFATSGWQQGLVQTETVKQGTTTLRTVTNTWTQDNTSVGYKTNPRIATSQVTLNDTGQQAQAVFTFDANGNILTRTEYDYGLVSVRCTQYSYLTGSAYTGRHILDRISQQVIYSTSCGTGGSLIAKTLYEYDNYTAGITSTGAIQHDSNYGNTFANRGNVTAVQRWRNTDNALLTTRSQFDDTGNVLSTTDPGNHTTTYSYADNYADGIGRNTFAYRTQVTNALGQSAADRYYFDTGLLERQTDSNNQTTTYTYDAMRRPLVTSNPDGGQTSLTYDDNTPAVTETVKLDASQNIVRKTVSDGDGRVIQTQLVSDPQGTVFVDTVYDGMGRKSSVSNPYRSTQEATYGVTQWQYDNQGRITLQVPPDGSSSSNNVSYTYSGNCTTVTDQAGKQQRSCADALGRVSQVDEPGGPTSPTPGTGSVSVSGTEQSHTSTSSGTSGSGSVTISGAENSLVTDPCLDEGMGRSCPTTTWDTGSVSITVNGYTKSVSYVHGSTPASIASALASAFNGDGASPVTASASSATVTITAKTTGAATNYTLSAASSTSDPADFVTASFTATRSSSTLTGGSDGTSTTTYNTGTVTVTVSGFAAPANYGQGSTAASVAQALTNSLNGASSPVTATLSGSSITVTSKTSGSSTNFTLSYSSTNDQPGTFAQPSFAASGPSALSGGTDGITLQTPNSTFYAYDVLDDLVQIQQKGGSTDSAQWRTRSFTYNSLKQKTAENTPEGGSVSYGYDNDGNQTTVTDARGITVTSTLDALDRITGKTYSNSEPAVSYFYDQTSYNGLAITNGIGRQTGMSDAAGAQAWSYDPMGRVLVSRRTTNGVTQDFTYAYNFDGSTKSILYPSGRRVDYAYNAAGKMVSAVDAADGINYAQNATYAPNGGLTSAVYGAGPAFGGLTRAVSYDKRFHFSSITGSSPSQTFFSLTYDYNLGVADNATVRQITNNLNAGRTQTFTYDPWNRISTAQVPTDWGLSFTYDAWGNLLAQTVTKGSAPGLNLTVNAKNQVTSTGFSYDTAGNLLGDGSHSYTWNADEMLASAAGVNYTYDGLHERLKKSNGTLYWEASSCSLGSLATTDLSGVLADEYVFFNGERIARRTSAGNVYYYFSDHLGSVRVITDSGGTVVYDTDYYPFGGARPAVSTLADRYNFIAHERDAESGLDYYKFRMLATQNGRWTSPDPIMGSPTVPQSLGRYAYVSDNPTNATDPLGLFRRGGGDDGPPSSPPFFPGGLCWPGWTPPGLPSIPFDGLGTGWDGAGWDIRCFEPQPIPGPPDPTAPEEVEFCSCDFVKAPNSVSCEFRCPRCRVPTVTLTLAAIRRGKKFDQRCANVTKCPRGVGIELHDFSGGVFPEVHTCSP